MSNLNRDDAKERRRRSLDTIAVKNITSEDIVFWQDKTGPSAERIMVPKAQKDIGHGKGINHLPRYLARRFAGKLVEQIITKEADKQLVELRKENRRLPKPERLQIEENEVVRTNNRTRIEELGDKIWLGIVKEFGGDALPEPMDETLEQTGDAMKDVVSNLANKKYEPDTQDK